MPSSAEFLAQIVLLYKTLLILKKYASFLIVQHMTLEGNSCEPLL